ncbi:ADP-ribosyl-(dinitrogen reductase) hydrolase [Janthinobacterium sp. LB2P49]|uniref:ADP-ribosyl-(dinitrogen reductase) hydrolase n=1 Tax=Janthinobacterium sp. LB2P49 TaxID=3424198 RepID=UPI003F240576
MPPLIISTAIRVKLDVKHNVSENEIQQCFFNQEGISIEDDREDHRTDPATWWFISQTNQCRTLKVIFVLKDGNIHIKSAYDAGAKDIAIYEEKNS